MVIFLDWVYGFTVFFCISLFLITTSDLKNYFSMGLQVYSFLLYTLKMTRLVFILEWVYRYTVFYCISIIFKNDVNYFYLF